ncbi:hypothetical protein TruAng_009669 [Truncatella angustata]|nr:hypothetical protein TruAng_009669 [Truncatella angustata]
MRSPLISDCILAVAAGDLSKYEPASSELHSLANGFYGQAVAGVRSAVSHEYLLSEPVPPPDYIGHTSHSNAVNDLCISSSGDDTLLAILLLCVHENFTMAGRLLPHLNAAAMVCHRRFVHPASDSSLRGLLFEVFCYFFALAAFSHGQQLPLHLAQQVFISPFLSAEHSQDILLAPRCRRVFSCILKVAMLTKTLGSANGPYYEATISELRELEAQLVSEPALPSRNVEAAASHEDTISELYRVACAVYVKMTLDPDLSYQYKSVQDLVVQFVLHLNQLPATSPANSIMVWPLVVVGMSAVSVAHQRLIVGRLRALHKICRSDIVTKSADMLGKIWRENNIQPTSSPHSSYSARDTVTPGCMAGRKITEYEVMFL